MVHRKGRDEGIFWGVKKNKGPPARGLSSRGGGCFLQHKLQNCNLTAVRSSIGRDLKCGHKEGGLLAHAAMGVHHFF